MIPIELDKECIHYTKGKCLLENEFEALNEDNMSCENCFYRYKLKEGEETTITETYILKRINGKLVKVIEDLENKNNKIYVEL